MSHLVGASNKLEAKVMKWISFMEQMPPVRVINSWNEIAGNVASMKTPIYLKSGNATYIAELFEWKGTGEIEINMTDWFRKGNGEKSLPFFTHWAPIERPKD